MSYLRPIVIVVLICCCGTVFADKKAGKKSSAKLSAHEKEIVRRAKREFLRAKRSKAPSKELQKKMQSSAK